MAGALCNPPDGGLLVFKAATAVAEDFARRDPYVVNGLVICIVAPVVEELAFRGLGYGVLERFGRWTAIILVGIAFGLAHGLVEAFPFLAAFGAGLAYLRSRVNSVYPGMIVHGLFNAAALIVAVSGKPQQENIVRACAGLLSFLPHC